jgi:hypothetical protein
MIADMLAGETHMYFQSSETHSGLNAYCNQYKIHTIIVPMPPKR